MNNFSSTLTPVRDRLQLKTKIRLTYFSTADLWHFWKNFFFSKKGVNLVHLRFCLFQAFLCFQEKQKKFTSYTLKLFFGRNRALSSTRWHNQGILKGEVSLYHWPPVWLVWNQLCDNSQFLFLFAKQTNPKQSNRRSTVRWYIPV